MHLDTIANASAVKPAEIALSVMKTHQTMNRRNLSERGFYCVMCIVLSHALNPNTDQCSEPWLGTLSDQGLHV